MKRAMTGIAVAMLLLGGVAYANASGAESSMAPGRPLSSVTQTTRMHTGTALSGHNPAWPPSYEMRSDGLMINGLLPAPGWQG